MSAAIKQDKETDRAARELWHTAGIGDVDRLNQLMNQGVDVNVCDRTGVTALMRAAYHGQLSIVQALIEQKADLNARDSGGLTALTMAKHAGHPDIVDVLLSAGAQAKTEASTKRRLVGSFTDESIEATPDNPSPKIKKSTQVRTLHEPPEIWDLVRINERVEDHPISTPTNNVAARILESEEAHTTQPRDPTEVVAFKRFSFGRALVVGFIGLVICAGLVFGFLSLRNAFSRSQPDTVSTAPNPISSSKPVAIPEAVPEKPRRLEPTAVAPVSEPPKLSSALTSKTHIATPSSAPEPEKKPVVKRNTTAAKNSEQFFVDNDESARRASRSDNEERVKSSAAKKEPSKPPATQATDPAKPNPTQKPKVIQWP
jgi:Ankyrin repeats (3 copies)